MIPEDYPDTHPAYYTAHPTGVECIQIAEHMNFNTGSAVKCLWRADLNGHPMEDLKKARWYIDREIQRLGHNEQEEPCLDPTCPPAIPVVFPHDEAV